MGRRIGVLRGVAAALLMSVGLSGMAARVGPSTVMPQTPTQTGNGSRLPTRGGHSMQADLQALKSALGPGWHGGSPVIPPWAYGRAPLKLQRRMHR